MEDWIPLAQQNFWKPHFLMWTEVTTGIPKYHKNNPVLCPSVFSPLSASVNPNITQLPYQNIDHSPLPCLCPLLPPLRSLSLSPLSSSYPLSPLSVTVNIDQLPYQNIDLLSTSSNVPSPPLPPLPLSVPSPSLYSLIIRMEKGGGKL